MYLKDESYHYKIVKHFYIAITLIVIFNASMDIYLARYTQVFYKFLSISSLVILFYFFIKTKKSVLFAYLLAFETDISIMLLAFAHNFNDYYVIYAIIYPVGIFLLMSLRRAVIVVILHHLTWALIFIYASSLFESHDFLTNKVAIMKFYTASIITVLMSYLYRKIIQDTYDKLAESDAHKEVLLREIHHRIKNNLNFISSILGLQQKHLKHKNAEALENTLNESRLRVSAISLVHNTLYKQPNLALVNFEKYTNSLAENINRATSNQLKVNIHTENISVKIDTALMLGIMINELLTNSIKYAFDPNEKKEVSITLTKNHSEFHFIYRDHTKKTIDIDKIEKSKGLGVRLIKIAAKDLDAKLSIYTHRGLIYDIKFHERE
jgi:two-component sensor histidine kinase